MRVRRKDTVLLILDVILIGLAIGVLGAWLSVPQWFGQAAVITAILLLLFALRYPFKLKPTLLSKERADQVIKWIQSGDLATMLEGLSRKETLRLGDMTRNRFGEVVLNAGPKGKQWTQKEPRIGLKILASGYEGKLVYNVILYRRDLASAKQIPRPWRTISRRESNLQLFQPSRLTELLKLDLT